MFKVQVINSFFDTQNRVVHHKHEVFVCSKERYQEWLNKKYIIPYQPSKRELREQRLKNTPPQRFSKKHWEVKNKKVKLSEETIQKYKDKNIQDFLSQLYLRKITKEKLIYRTQKSVSKFTTKELEECNYKQIVIPFIRHSLTNYDNLLSIAGSQYKNSKNEIHDVLKSEVYNLIKRAYPFLEASCNYLQSQDNK